MVREILLEHGLHQSRMKLFIKFGYDKEAIALVKIKHTFEPSGANVIVLNKHYEVNRHVSIEIKKPSNALPHLNEMAVEKIENFKYWMRSRRYSASTISLQLPSNMVSLFKHFGIQRFQSRQLSGGRSKPRKRCSQFLQRPRNKIDKMQEPNKMLSKITETNSEITISTQKRKSWVLVIFLSLITLQFTNALIHSLFFANELPMVGRIVILILSLTIIYFALKGLLWQLKGVRQINISNSELKISKLSPLWSKTKIYRPADIKSVEIKDETVSEGPLAMLQLLKINDKIKITFSYGYETIIASSGVDMSEAIELKNIIRNKLGLN